MNDGCADYNDTEHETDGDRETGGQQTPLLTDGSGSTEGSVAGQTAGGTGLEPNVAGALSYVLLFITGIIFYVITDDEFVKFHAAQSIVLFLALVVVRFVVNAVFSFFGPLGVLLNGLISLAILVLWVLLIVTTYQGQTRRIPVAADVADSLMSRDAGQ